MPARIAPRKPVKVYLAEWRKHVGLSQLDVAERLKGGKDTTVDKGTISRWENARRAPSLDVLAAYAEALEIPVQYLYRRPSDRESLDDMVARAPKHVQDTAHELVSVLVKRDR